MLVKKVAVMIINLTEVHESQKILSSFRWQYWKTEVFLSFHWWFLLAIPFSFILIWIKIVDRKNLRNIVLNGTITLSIVFFLDVFGGELQLWEYPYMVLPWDQEIYVLI
jgi:hypothetical protein